MRIFSFNTSYFILLSTGTTYFCFLNPSQLCLPFGSNLVFFLLLLMYLWHKDRKYGFTKKSDEIVPEENILYISEDIEADYVSAFKEYIKFDTVASPT